jgi:hypothetical protein
MEQKSLQLVPYAQRHAHFFGRIFLADFFGRIAEFWFNLQTLYEIRMAERKLGRSIKTPPTLKHRHASA